VTLKIGLIGAGTHGMRYLRHASNDVIGMEPVMLCNRNAENAEANAKEIGCGFTTNPIELIDKSDAVIICTPPSSHFELGKMVVDAGKPLLIEKPFTGTLSEAEILHFENSGSPTPLMLAQTLRWNPVLQQVALLWEKLGKVHHIRLVHRLEPTNLAWQKDKEITVGGSVLLTGVHIIDTVRYLTGSEFSKVNHWQDQVLNPVVEDFFLTRATLTDGCKVSMEVSKYTQSRACLLEVVGENGSLEADYLFGGITLKIGKEIEKLEIDASIPTLPGVLESWLSCALECCPPPVTSLDGLESLRVIDACYTSSLTNSEVSLEQQK
jgi:predicted dehydrogenase